MIRTTYTCDKCGKEIKDIYYSLTCYAEDVRPHHCAIEVVQQNGRQNLLRQQEERHRCNACKDAITDGIFIV